VEPQGEPKSVPAVEMQDEDGNTFFAQPVPVLDEGGDPVKDEDGNIVLETDENGNIVVETDTDGNVVHAEVILDENEVPMVVVEEPTEVVEVLVLPFTEPAPPETCAALESCCDTFFQNHAYFETCIIDAMPDCCEEDNPPKNCCNSVLAICPDDFQCSDGFCCSNIGTCEKCPTPPAPEVPEAAPQAPDAEPSTMDEPTMDDNSTPDDPPTMEDDSNGESPPAYVPPVPRARVVQPPKDCIGTWTHYSECTATCGIGYRTRTYTHDVEAEVGGDACPFHDGHEYQSACNMGDCPPVIDCQDYPLNFHDGQQHSKEHCSYWKNFDVNKNHCVYENMVVCEYCGQCVDNRGSHPSEGMLCDLNAIDQNGGIWRNRVDNSEIDIPESATFESDYVHLSGEALSVSIPTNPNALPTVTYVIRFRLPEAPTNKGWIMSQAPDYYRSRAITVADERFGNVGQSSNPSFDSNLGQVPIGEWNLIIATWTQDGDCQCWLNGNAGTVSTCTSGSGSSTSEKLIIGGRNVVDFVHNPTSIDISNVIVYDHTLSQEEIDEIVLSYSPDEICTGEWSDWGQCTSTVGEGTWTRYRMDPDNCDDEQMDIGFCNIKEECI